MAEQQSELYLKAGQVRERYGNASDMWIARRLKDAAFPKPVYFGALRFWRESDLIAWEKEQIATPGPKPLREMEAARAAKAKNAVGKPKPLTP